MCLMTDCGHVFCHYELHCLSSFIDEVLSENFLDYKSRGVSGSHKGQIVWRIDTSLYFMEGKYSLPVHSETLQMLPLAFMCPSKFIWGFLEFALIRVHLKMFFPSKNDTVAHYCSMNLDDNIGLF